MAKRADLEPQIVTEWLKRPAGKRTGMDVVLFYSELSKCKSPLLSFRTSGDKYQALKSILRNHIDR